MTSGIGIAVVVLLAAWGLDSWRRNRIWRAKPIEELLGIVAGHDWRRWELALGELKRRGHDIAGAIPGLAGRLLSESKWERAAARIVLMNVYPETRPLLKSYRASDDESTRRKALEPFFAKFNASTTSAA
jgi:hypothetical protein